MLIGLSKRQGKTRNLYNYSLRITGSACLLIGTDKVKFAVMQMISSLGGHIVDEWVKRIDLCLDLPGIGLSDWILQAFIEKRFISSAKRWNPWDGASGKTGFSVGSKKRVKLNVYDKLNDTINNQREDYQRGMIDYRWHGKIPKKAIRIEFQISKSWLDGYGLKTLNEVMNNLPNIVDKLTNRSGGKSKVFFWMSADLIDKENKHQSRANVLPEWEATRKFFQSSVGIPFQPLKPIQRNLIECSKAFSNLKGYLTSIAAIRGEEITCNNDAINLFKKMILIHNISNQEWIDLYKSKVIRIDKFDSNSISPQIKRRKAC